MMIESSLPSEAPSGFSTYDELGQHGSKPKYATQTVHCSRYAAEWPRTTIRSRLLKQHRRVSPGAKTTLIQLYMSGFGGAPVEKAKRAAEATVSMEIPVD